MSSVIYKGVYCLSMFDLFILMYDSQSNFLQEFGKLNPKRSKGSKGKQLLHEVLWLELLLNLSFSLEGQQMILKIPGKSLQFGLQFSGNFCFHDT